MDDRAKTESVIGIGQNMHRLKTDRNLRLLNMTEVSAVKPAVKAIADIYKAR